MSEVPGDASSDAGGHLPAHDRSTGGIEQHLRRIYQRIEDRRHMFANRERLNRLLMLMTIEMRGSLDEREWAKVIRSCSSSLAACRRCPARSPITSAAPGRPAASGSAVRRRDESQPSQDGGFLPIRWMNSSSPNTDPEIPSPPLHESAADVGIEPRAA